MVVRLEHINIMKMALFMGLSGVVIGLILGIVVAVINPLITPSIPEGIVGGGIFSLASGFMAIIILPILYGAINFVSGLIFTPIMNLILKITKGIDLEMVEVEESK